MALVGSEQCTVQGSAKPCIQEGCEKFGLGTAGLCKEHGGVKMCANEGCDRAAEEVSQLCVGHGGRKCCSHDACVKGAAGPTGLCIAHGGGIPCSHEQCTQMVDASIGLCATHGQGVKRARPDNSVQAATDGGKRRRVGNSLNPMDTLVAAAIEEEALGLIALCNSHFDDTSAIIARASADFIVGDVAAPPANSTGAPPTHSIEAPPNVISAEEPPVMIDTAPPPVISTDARPIMIGTGDPPGTINNGVLATVISAGPVTVPVEPPDLVDVAQD